MNRRALRADLLLIITAAVWGFGFVAQRSGMNFVGPFAFNGVRFILGSLSLLPLIFYRKRNLNSSNLIDQNFIDQNKPFMQNVRQLGRPVLTAGLVLFFAVLLQQLGIIFTDAGNAGFITGFYVVLTPVFGIFIGRKTGIATWIGCVFTLTGLYFISVAGRPSVNPGDVLIIISAFFWAAHVLLIDRYMQKNRIDPIELSCGQFAITGVLSLLGAFLLEPHITGITAIFNPDFLNEGLFSWLPLGQLIAEVISGTVAFPAQAVIPILYGGLASVGIAYTLQVVAQQDAPPAHAVIILCFEGCFAVIGGMLLLGEKTGGWTLLGCGFMLAGMLATQWEVIRSRKLPNS